MSNKSKSKYKATDKGYKEEEEEELKETVPSKEEVEEIEELVEEKIENLENDFTVPYPDLGGHTVAQLAGFPEHKRQAILGPKDKEFTKKYHL